MDIGYEPAMTYWHHQTVWHLKEYVKIMPRLLVCSPSKSLRPPDTFKLTGWNMAHIYLGHYVRQLWI